MLIDNSMHDSDYCYECNGYGDNYSIDENGELVCNCDSCSMAQFIEEDWEVENDNKRTENNWNVGKKEFY